jgi:uncharacterized protein YdeI (YjbR/CyaY-like superfamily)
MVLLSQTAPHNLDTFHPLTRAEWHTWLEEHHAMSKGVWVISFKKVTGKPIVSYDEAVQEALCFGWIDSKPNKLDDERSMLLFTPRNAKSNWSRPNKIRVELLTKQGLMSPAGERMVELAKQSGAWDALNDVEDLVLPDDLQTAFKANPTAFEHWEAFSRSGKRGILEWILNAKRPETRAQRILETVSLAAQNKKANQFQRRVQKPFSE